MYKKYPKGLKLTPDKEHLVLDNLGIAHKLTQKWFNGVCDIEDIRQEAYLTLVDCATKYDPNSGNKFNTYAYTCIDLRLNNYVQSYNKLINIPINKIYKIYKYLHLPEEEKEEFRLQAKLTMNDIKFYKNYEIISIDAQVVDDYEDVNNLYAVDEEGYERSDNIQIIQKIFKSLKNIIHNKLDRMVFAEVILADFDSSKYKEIGKKYNIKVKDVLAIIERCQQIMKEHKSDFI